jgi:hypothetical protein
MEGKGSAIMADEGFRLRVFKRGHGINGINGTNGRV